MCSHKKPKNNIKNKIKSKKIQIAKRERNIYFHYLPGELHVTLVLFFLSE